ncbi:MAG: T9SS type A sorting domain-containing protein [Flavobacteriaceae bacterium]
MITRVLFFFLCCLTASAQQYLPMLQEDRQWSVDMIFGDPFGGTPPPISTEQITLTGGVVVNGQTYFRVNNNSGETGCLVREENGIVYRLGPNDQEHIMYDFTLEVNDTFELPDILMDSYCSIYGWYIFEQTLVVVDTYTQNIAGANRKIIEFEEYDNGIEYWIEGIGSIRGFDPVGETVDTNTTQLVCFTEGGQTTFFNDATSCDNTTLSLQDLHKPKFLLVPNPVKQTSQILLPPNSNGYTIKIFDLNGRLLNEFANQKNTLTIKVGDFLSGLYFYQVFEGNKHLNTERFLVR